FSAAYWNASTFGDDQYSEVTIGNGGTTGAEALGVIVRAEAGVDGFYLLFVTNGQWQLYLRSGGSYTLLSHVEGASAPGDVIRLEAIGSAHPLTLYAYKNGALMTQYTTTGPSEVKTGGSPGILIYDGGHALSVDDWSGGPAHTSEPTATPTATA